MRCFRRAKAEIIVVCRTAGEKYELYLSKFRQLLSAMAKTFLPVMRDKDEGDKMFADHYK